MARLDNGWRTRAATGGRDSTDCAHVEPWASVRPCTVHHTVWLAFGGGGYASLPPLMRWLVGMHVDITPEWEQAHRPFHLRLREGYGMPAGLREVRVGTKKPDRTVRDSRRKLADHRGKQGRQRRLYEAVRAVRRWLAVKTPNVI